MKLQCHRPTLSMAFGTVGSVVPARTPKEILKNVRIIAENGTATLIGTDSEIGVRYEIPEVHVEEPGETLVPAGRFSQILRELTEDDFHLSIEDGGVWIRCGHSEFRLSPEDVADFPPVPSFEETAYLAMPGGVLKEAIRRTVIATDTESTRYALGGVLLEAATDRVTFAATDSRRLSVVEAPCRQEGTVESNNAGPVVPSKAMQLIERSITDEDAEVALALHENDAVMRVGQCTISSRLVQGRFPKYRAVIPDETPITIEMVAGPLYSAVRQAQIVTNDESRGVDFKFADGTLTLQSIAADVGQSKIELPIPYDGEALTITFDPRFVADVLRILDNDTAFTLHLTDGDSQAVIRVGDSFTYVIMPLSRDR
ncbi:DNA polymerase III subunit beta [Stratiformator vulcanicus]|uniref:Beta sliding clamp n=1 Tax=Stratiformator vulcanicus TaxID=2527980 RepID=A0A517QVI3_9PLAN|nr:DNA polymerase III subunit beta [Stratiformator vulcanicus]QDT35649.1 DNA polymerase III subunit beta [Stratiformator vulcanicus]